MAPALRRRLVTAAVLIGAAGGLTGWRIADNHTVDYSTEDTVVMSRTPTGTVQLDTRLYIPDGVSAQAPAPAVVLAHGFGGTKASVSGAAADLADRGYVVLAYTARGFGRSTGSIGLNALRGEVVDARNLVSWLARRPEVVKDREGDPRVGIAGESYGGALALMAAGTDRRVDAIVPQITWNRLSRVFFPNGAGAPQQGGPASPAESDSSPGAFKREWAGIFFGIGKGLDLGGVTGLGSLAGQRPQGDPSPGPGPDAGAAGPGASGAPAPSGAATAGEALVCGRTRHLPRLHRGRSQRHARRGRPRAAGRLEPVERRRRHHRSDLPGPGGGGHAVPPVGGRCDRAPDPGGRHHREGPLDRRRA